MSDCNCPKISKKKWDLKKQVWKKKAFYVTNFFQILHMPIGIGGAIEKGWADITQKKYKTKSPWMMLQEETGLFTARMLMEIKDFPKKDSNVEVWKNTTLYSKYHHGEFRTLGIAVKELMDFVEKKGKKIKQMYVWTTNCPKCWDKHGGPTNVIFARV